MKKFLYNPWTIGIGTTLLAFFLPIVLDLIKGLQILTTTKEILSFLFNIILTFFNFEIKVWWLLIAVAVLALALYIAVKIADVKADSQPAFFRYTKDTIQGWCWEWNWQKNSFGEYDVYNLHPICTHCGTPLIQSDPFYGRIKCLRCNRDYPNSLPNLDHIKMIILDTARRNLFTKVAE